MQFPVTHKFREAKEKSHYLETNQLLWEMEEKRPVGTIRIITAGATLPKRPELLQVPSKAKAGVCGTYLLVLTAMCRFLSFSAFLDHSGETYTQG